jgi:predicted ATPase
MSKNGANSADDLSPTKKARLEASPVVSSPVVKTPNPLAQEHSGAPIHRIVLTGGACAGKSTLLSTLQSTVPHRTGVKVFTVPEASTLLVQNGLEWSSMDTDERAIEYQLALLRVQLALEDNIFAIAKATGKPCLIVCDRGTMDGRAFCKEAHFKEIMRRGGYTLETLRDQRYDAVLHLFSAAIGAPSFYNYDNAARSETVDEARKSDEMLREMYIGHPRLKLIDNSTSFQEKLDRGIDFVYEVIGHSKPKHQMRRYQIRDAPLPDKIPVTHVVVNLTITILTGSSIDNVRMLFRREQLTSIMYMYHNIALDPESGSRTMMQHNISPREYMNLLEQRDPAHIDVVKTAISFTDNGQFCELSSFHAPAWLAGKASLYIDCDKETVVLPTWLDVLKDTTGDISYSSYTLSKRQGPSDEGVPE